MIIHESLWACDSDKFPPPTSKATADVFGHTVAVFSF